MTASRDGITRIVSTRTCKVSWQARWSHPLPSGERKFASKTFATRKAAQAHRTQQVAAIQRGTYVAATRLTFGDYSATWHERMKHIWVSSSYLHRKPQWDRHIGPVFGGIRLTAIDRPMCQRFVDGLIGKGLAPGTILNIVAQLGAILAAAVTDELIVRNPAAKLQLPTVPLQNLAIWTTEEVQAFLRGTVDQSEHALYYVMLATGVRVSEALALRWTDLDLDQANASVATIMRWQWDGSYQPAPGTKTGAGRLIDLTPGCVHALRRHKRQQAVSRARASIWDIRGFVFTRADGSPLSPSVVRYRLQKAVAELGLPMLTARTMRHISTTIMLENNVPERVIQDTLGHSSTKMLKRYGHVTPRLRRAASDRLAGVLDVVVGDDDAAEISR